MNTPPIPFMSPFLMMQANQTYSGKTDEDIEEFISTTKLLLSAAGNDEDQRKHFILCKLNGPPRITAKRFIAATPKATAQQLLDRLRVVYSNNGKDKEECMAEMKKYVKEQDETLVNYCEVKKGLLDQAGVTDGTERNLHIIRGLGSTMFERYLTNALESTTEKLIETIEKQEAARKRHEPTGSSRIQQQINRYFGPETVKTKKIETESENKEETAAKPAEPEADNKIELRRITEAVHQAISSHPMYREQPREQPAGQRGPARPPCRFCKRRNHESIDCYFRPRDGAENGSRQQPRADTRRYEAREPHRQQSHRSAAPPHRAPQRAAQPHRPQQGEAPRYQRPGFRRAPFDSRRPLECWTCRGNHRQQDCDQHKIDMKNNQKNGA